MKPEEEDFEGYDEFLELIQPQKSIIPEDVMRAIRPLIPDQKEEAV